MAQIFVNVTEGDGYAWVDKPYPYDGASVTLRCVPAEGESLVDIFATDSWDNPIALDPTAEVQTFTYDNNWRNVYIEVKFTGTTPPEPPTPPVVNTLLWLLFKAARNWRENGKY